MRRICYLAVCTIYLLAASTLLLGQSGDSANKPNETQQKSAEALFKQIRDAKPGQATFEAIDAVAKKIRETDAVDRRAILSLFITTMKDKSLVEPLRWPCCYVISLSGDEQGIPDLIEVLLKDESDIMRCVAAEALGGLPNNAAAHDALLQAARKDNNPEVRRVIAKYLGQTMPAFDPLPASASIVGVEELAPSGPPKPPTGPARPVAKPLPWPFVGDSKAQNFMNNYQTCNGAYIHLALDFMQPAGTEVKAVDSGYVAEITSEPTHMYEGFTITTQKGGNRGWGYLHMDSRTFTFKEGDFIQRGQVLGKVAEFAPNGQSRGDHLHLAYGSFTRGASGRGNFHSLLDPLYCFDWKDNVAPSFAPLLFVTEGNTEPFKADAAGVVTVKGKVDILAAIADSAYPGQSNIFGVPLVMLSISDGTHTMQKLVLDHRGDVGDWKQFKPLYLSLNEGRRLFTIRGAGYFQTLRVTKTDGDGRITYRDENECWDTTASGANGKALWPDGEYSVNVYAWDAAGNQGVSGAIVQVKNNPGL